ncbi:Uncharacterized conserved protein, DUF1015 family [Geoalkalibacter ferrihydriticus]|uniref:SpoOJ/ParA/ParB/repB family protein n=2 Tax=Geoalkalibacter ferrihydriticus TaxID=392333 RepID=A0A0C2EE79_9BACT|nr:DUF1015 domain-containing protein [Geoalkalibacter ferrihydriticus]KIH76918.1 hypothetical protein GFER_07460 [Geoalkalibacter ferrihydriticus DSM 17813]SDL44506.1 Uncharacterized conserved protein, DUF1015 family [Geoalkalibacter ferrihydriticus]
MAKIVAFRGLRYNLKKITDPNLVVAPPYDVISPVDQEELYRRDPHNVVRLILGRNNADDTETDNRYTRAARDFRQWLDDETLVRDTEPSIYLYDQEYPLEEGDVVVRQGFMALTRIEDFSSGVVKPHEKTLAGLKTDRLKLIRACGANFSPVFTLYGDSCCVLEALNRKERERVPDVAVTDADGVRHRLWQVTDPSLIAKAQSLIENKPLFIADGHHRYETAINYRNEMREKHPDYTGKELFNYVLMYFSNMDDKGMLIFPTHRLLRGLERFNPAEFLNRLKEYFEIESSDVDPKSSAGRQTVRKKLREKGRQGHVLAFFSGGGTLHYLRLKDDALMDRFFDDKSPKALRTLDVSILHRLIFEDLLHLGAEAQEQQTHLDYVKNFDDPFDAVLSGRFQAAFIMNPPRMSEVRDVANAGEKMPQNSTYFYPKLLTGLVINPIVEGESVDDFPI